MSVESSVSLHIVHAIVAVVIIMFVESSVLLCMVHAVSCWYSYLSKAFSLTLYSTCLVVLVIISVKSLLSHFVQYMPCSIGRHVC